MSDPLVPERPGSLAELGVQPHPVTPLDEMAELEEMAQASTAEESAIPEPEAPPPEMPPEDQAEPEAEPVEEVQAQESILKSIIQQDAAPPEESEITRLRQENARLEGLVEGRLQGLENQIRQAAPDEEPKETVEEDLIHSAPVRQVLSHLREEDPAEYEAALVRIAEEQATRKFDARFKALEDAQIQEKQLQQQQTQAQTTLHGINNVLVDIEGKGGLEAELIQQLRASPQQSYLGAKFGANPGILASPEGIRMAVADVSAELQSRYEAQQSNAAQVSPSVEASAGGGGPSTRGVSLGEKPTEKTPEEQIVDDMMSVGHRTKALGFLD